MFRFLLNVSVVGIFFSISTLSESACALPLYYSFTGTVIHAIGNEYWTKPLYDVGQTVNVYFEVDTDRPGCYVYPDGSVIYDYFRFYAKYLGGNTYNFISPDYYYEICTGFNSITSTIGGYVYYTGELWGGKDDNFLELFSMADPSESGFVQNWSATTIIPASYRIIRPHNQNYYSGLYFTMITFHLTSISENYPDNIPQFYTLPIEILHPTPEPSTFLLFGAGLGGLALLRRNARK